jgi:hypothetical protein
LHQFGDLFELKVKQRNEKVKLHEHFSRISPLLTVMGWNTEELKPQYFILISRKSFVAQPM